MEDAPATRPVPRARRTDVLLVGGGTVGHLAPGFALAERLRAAGLGVGFATPGESGEAAWFPPAEPPPWHTPSPRLPRRGPALALFPARLAGAVLQAHALLRRLAPRAVVGLGGWPCVPAALAAAVARVPLFLLAADARPGVAVRSLARLARRIYVSQASAAAALGPHARVVLTGPVLRPEIGAGRRDPSHFGLARGVPTLLVTGGSLGAQALNEAAARGVALAVRRQPGRAATLQVLHSVGKSGAGVAEAYDAAGVRHHVTPFIQAMGDAYATADLVLSRAGAVTCAEIEAARLPAVLVPYPHHADRQQYANAARLVDRGGALLLEERHLDPERVAEVVVPLLEDPARLAAMAARLGGGAPGGATQIADDLVRSLRRGPTHEGLSEGHGA